MRVTKDYVHLRETANAINDILPAEYKDAYFQLVLHPVKACANLYDMYHSAALNAKLSREKNIIANGGYNRETGEAELQNNTAQFISFGSLFLANPDLPKRFELNAALNEPDRATMYGGGDDKGNTDYPALAL